MFTWAGAILIGLLGIAVTPIWVQSLRRHDYNSAFMMLLVTVLGFTQVLLVSPVSRLIPPVWLVGILGVIYFVLLIVAGLFFRDLRRGRIR